MNTPLISPAARRAFGPLFLRRRTKSVPELAAASVQLAARAGENRTRDDGLNCLGAAYAAAWVCTQDGEAATDDAATASEISELLRNYGGRRRDRTGGLRVANAA